MRLVRISIGLLFLGLSTGLGWAGTMDRTNLSWTEQKCVLYQSAWDWAYASIDPANISQEFVNQNDEFVSKGCIERTVVCPRSETEIELANMLTVMTMNEGMASTFVPFRCSDETQ